jgi:rubredoxin
MSSNRFKWLKCKLCGTILERMFSNEYLEELYPVEEKIKIGNVKHDENMKMHLFAKKLWVCPDCGLKKELSFFEYVRIIITYLHGDAV